MSFSGIVSRVKAVVAASRSALRSRNDLILENLALRQQVAVLKQERPRPHLCWADRCFWVFLRRVWRKWTGCLAIVQADTVAKWHRGLFKCYWRWLSRRRKKRGRPCTRAEIRKLIRQMAEENSGWGAPRIHGELEKLGFVVSEQTVSRYLQALGRDRHRGQDWVAFLSNHRDVLGAVDFFTVPTATFRVLYVFLQRAQRGTTSTAADGSSTGMRRSIRPLTG